MIEELKAAFGWNIDDCLVEISDVLIQVYDCYDCTPDQQRSYIKNDQDQPVHFTIDNPNSENLVFAALDNCILKSHNQSRCDFIIGNFKKLYFVEIKQVKLRKRRQARSNALRQLASSLQLLKGKIDLAETELIAIMCLKSKEARPRQSAEISASKVAFKENYNAELAEAQQATF